MQGSSFLTIQRKTSSLPLSWALRASAQGSTAGRWRWEANLAGMSVWLKSQLTGRERATSSEYGIWCLLHRSGKYGDVEEEESTESSWTVTGVGVLLRPRRHDSQKLTETLLLRNSAHILVLERPVLLKLLTSKSVKLRFLQEC